MNQVEAYRRWLSFLKVDAPPLFALGNLLPYTSVSQRKVLLTQARCQVVPSLGSRLFHRNKELYRSVLVHPLAEFKGIVLLHDLGLHIAPYANALFSGFISVLVRTAPYMDYSSIYQELEDGKKKELYASQNERDTAEFSYAAIFGAGKDRNSTRLSWNLPMSLEVRAEISSRLGRSYPADLSRRIFYPRYSTKLIGDRAIRNARRLQHLAPDLDLDSTKDLEVLYHRTGIRVLGETEMRWSWKYTELKPRVYYAQGPDQYYSSRYIQAIFNILVDSLPNTHRFGRFNPQDFQVPKEDTSFIYDYSSFTSQLYEIRRFTHALADFFRGKMVTIVDSKEGLVDTDLGLLLHEYNQACNFNPDFDVSRLIEVEDYVLSHKCGMLGVPGNISSCTLLHGIHLAVITNSLNNNKVVGDDAIALFTPTDMDTRETLHDALSNIGGVALQKMEFWDYVDEESSDEQLTWHYVKRPVTRIESRMAFGQLAIWPDLANVLALTDPVHTISLPALHFRKKKYGSQVETFLTQVETSFNPSDGDMILIRCFLRACHRKLDIPFRGGIFFENGFQFRCPSAYWSGDYVTDMKDAVSGQIIMIQRKFDASIHYAESLTAGSSFLFKGHPMLKLMTDLGYIERKTEYRRVVGDECVEDLEAIILKEFTPVSSYTVLMALPQYAHDVLLQATHVPASDSESLQDTDVEDWT